MLRLPESARFLRLPKRLTKAAVSEIFETVLARSNGRPISRQLRIRAGSESGRFLYSFLCFRMESPVAFLSDSDLRAVQYGFVLLIERNGHLAVLQRGAKGLDRGVAKKSRRIERRTLTNLFAERAQYRKLSMKRMTVGRQEIRVASYEAKDLETALTPSATARSILQTIHLTTATRTNVSITPGSGRVRRGASRSDLEAVVAFMDDIAEAMKVALPSRFLSTFSEPLELDELPANVHPAGVLVDLGELHDALSDPERPAVLLCPSHDPSGDLLLEVLADVLRLEDDGGQVQAVRESGEIVATLKKLKDSYNLWFTFSGDYQLQEYEGTTVDLATWLRRKSSFSIAFTSPEYFYSDGSLYRVAGFRQEAEQVHRLLTPDPHLAAAASEKGGAYTPAATQFDDDSIFRILETSIANDDSYLWCGDLGDEWADYIGATSGRITFYHCKHGKRTTGASDFQVVVGQATKNLSRVKLRAEEVQRKVQQAAEREYWGNTAIPLLARGDGGWQALEKQLAGVISDPAATWRVALVVTALSARDFESALAETNPAPHFIQLVWLLSGFISACRERGAQPLIYCRT